MMIRTILVAAAALASISFDPVHAEGALAPYCAVISLGTGSVYWDCQYYSFEDCYRRGNILAGNRGFCNANGYAANAAEYTRPVKRRARPY